MRELLDRLKEGVLLADGAIGTMLFQRGLKSGDCPEALNLGSPEVPKEVASLYLEAGAKILQTNTFGASPIKLAEYNLEDRTEEINKRGVEIV